ncbi:two-partner secretion domain-containing protein [Microbulbifer celer]|uniref:Filamentous hemagglutinin N-terminal domain-containing protein n=1 Tax=Microbulbifer celer TaxID=435905 RepID=A0ABW3U4R3_9GAMM|nr:filamentous hemagglutinin N-terminal domain-containing protein [Microbulbifer celer]UFN56751.1 filamentous hemagglutinin N-terminal domain-containing protein [Microbulbifer celer]
MMTRKLKKLSSAIKVWHLACAGAMVGQVISPAALAGPKGGVVTGGDGDISINDLATIVDQKTDLLSIDWDSFNLSEEELVKFLQPNSSSVVLNRILDQSPSEIRGSIQANGHVILANPRGVLFTETATVNVGSITAAGLDMDPADFHNGDFSFTSKPGSAGVVVNRGVINAASAVLVGRQVTNAPGSLISAELVSLTAADEALLTFDADGLIGVQVTKAVMENQMGVDSAVINQGAIEGTQVLMEASVSGDLFTAAVNNEGVVRAQGIDTSGGSIRLTASGGSVTNTGTLDASGSTGGNVVLEGDSTSHSGAITVQANAGVGGEVKLLGDTVQVSGEINARGSAGGGEVLIGGGYQGKDSAVRNADSTTVTAEAIVDASGTGSGDGGTVVVWADGDTDFAGSIYAESGELGGNGGLVETSGKQTLRLDNDALSVSTRAHGEGSGGTWLLDPIWLEIAGDCTGLENCMEAATLKKELDEGNTVSIVAGSGNINSDTDAITVSGDLSWLNGTLELIADGNIQIEAGISLTAALNDLVIDTTGADLDDPENPGDLFLGDGASITVGDLTANLAGSLTNDGTITTNDFSLTLGAGQIDPVDTTNTLGDLTVNGSGQIVGSEATDSFILQGTNDLVIDGDNQVTLNGNIEFSAVDSIDLGEAEDGDTVSGREAESWLVTSSGVEAAGINFISAVEFSASGSSLQLSSDLVGSDPEYKAILLARRETEDEELGTPYVGYAGYKFSGLQTAGQVVDGNGDQVVSELELNASGWDEEVSLTDTDNSLSAAGVNFSNIKKATASKLVDFEPETGEDGTNTVFTIQADNKVSANSIVFSGLNTIDAGTGQDSVYGIDANPDEGINGQNWKVTSDGIEASGILLQSAENFFAAGSSLQMDSDVVDDGHNEITLARRGPAGEELNGTAYIDYAGYEFEGLQAVGQVLDGAGNEISTSLTLNAGGWDKAVSLTETANTLSSEGISFSNISTAIANTVNTNYVDSSTGNTRSDKLSITGADTFSLLDDSDQAEISFSSVTSITADSADQLVFSDKVSLDQQVLALTSNDKQVTYQDSLTVSGITDVTVAKLEDFEPGAGEDGTNTVFTIQADNKVSANSIVFSGLKTIDAGSGDDTVEAAEDIAEGATWNLSDTVNNASVEHSGSVNLAFENIETVKTVGAIVDGTQNGISENYRLDGSGLSAQGILFTSASEVNSSQEEVGADTISTSYGTFNLRTSADETEVTAGGVSIAGIDFSGIDEVNADSGATVVGTSQADTFTIITRDGGGAENTGVQASSIDFYNISNVEGGAEDSIVTDILTINNGAKNDDSKGKPNKFSGISFSKDIAKVSATTIQVLDSNDATWSFNDDGNILYSFDDSLSPLEFFGVEKIEAGSGSDNVEGVSGENWTIFDANSANHNAIDFYNIEQVTADAAGFLSDQYKITSTEIDGAVQYGVSSYGIELLGSNTFDAVDPGTAYASLDGSALSKAVILGGNDHEIIVEGENWSFSNVGSVTAPILETNANGLQFTVGENTNDLTISTSSISFSGLSEVHTGDTVNNQLFTRSNVEVSGADGSLKSNDISFTGIDSVAGVTEDGSTVTYDIIGSESAETFAIVGDNQVNWLVGDSETVSFADVTGIDAGEASASEDPGNPAIDKVFAIGTVTLTGNDHEANSDSGIFLSNIDKISGGNLVSSGNGDTYTIASDNEVSANKILFSAPEKITGASINDEVIVTVSDVVWGFDDNGNVTFGDWVFDNILHFAADGSTLNGPAGLQEFSLDFDNDELVVDVVRSGLSDVAFKGLVAVNGNGAGSVTGVSDAAWLLGSSAGEVISSGITFTGISSFNAVGGALTGSDAAENFEVFRSAEATDEQWDVRVGDLTFKGLTSVSGNSASSESTQIDTVSLDVLAEAKLTGIDGEADIHGIQFKEIEEITNATVTASAGSDRFTILGNQRVEANAIDFEGISIIDSLGEGDHVAGGVQWELVGTDRKAKNSGITFTGLTSVSADGQTLVGTSDPDTYTLSTVSESGRTVTQLNTAGIDFTGLSKVESDASDSGGDEIIASGYGDYLTLIGELNALEVEKREGGNLIFSGISDVESEFLKGTNGNDRFIVTLNADGEPITSIYRINFSSLEQVNARNGLGDTVVAEGADASIVFGGASIHGIDFTWVWSVDGVESVFATGESDTFEVLGSGRVSVTNKLVDGLVFNSFGSVDALGGDDTVIGLSGEDWTLLGFENAENNGISFEDVELLIADDGALVGLDVTDTESGNDNFELTGDGHIKTLGMDVSGMTRVDARGGVNSLDASSFTGAFFLTGTAGEVSTDIDYLVEVDGESVTQTREGVVFSGIDTADLVTLNTTSASESLSLNADGALLVGTSGISFTGLSSVIDQGGSDTLTSSLNNNWVLADDGSLDVTHGNITFAGIEVFSGGNGVLNGGSAANNYVASGQKITVDNEARTFNDVVTVNAGGGADDLVTGNAVTLTDALGGFKTDKVQFSGLKSLQVGDLTGSSSSDTFEMLNDSQLSIYGLTISGLDTVSAIGGSTVKSPNSEAYTLLKTGGVHHFGIDFTGVTQFDSSGAVLTATDASETFTYSTGVKVNGMTFNGLSSVDGNGGTDTLAAEGYSGDLVLTGTSGELTNQDSSLTFTDFTNVQATSLRGSTAADVFKAKSDVDLEQVSVRGLTFTGLTTVDGGDGEDTVNAVGDDMALEGHESVTVFDSITFTDIENASGGGFDLAGTSDSDIFTVTSSGGVKVSGINIESFGEIDGGGGKDKVIGADGADWQLLSVNSASNNNVNFINVEELQAVNANLLGIDDATISDFFFLDSDGSIRMQVGAANWEQSDVSEMLITGMGQVIAGAGTSDLNASVYGAALALNGSSGELKAGDSLLFKGIDSATLSSLTLSDGVDELKVSGSQQLRVADIDFSGLSTVIDSGASDTVTSTVGSDWVMADDGSFDVSHANITFAGVETFSGGSGVLNGGSATNNYVASGRKITVDNETRTFNGVGTVNAGGDDHLTTADTITLMETEGHFTNGSVDFNGFGSLAADALVATSASEEFGLSNGTVSIHKLVVSGLSSLDTGGGTDTITGEAGADYLLAANGDVTHGNIVFSNSEIFVGDGAALTASDADDVFTLTAADALTLQATGQQFSGLISADTAGGADRIVFSENFADSERAATITGNNAVSAGNIQFSNIESLRNTGALTATEGSDVFSVVGNGILDSSFGIRFEGVASVSAEAGSDTVNGLASESWQLREGEKSVFHAGMEFTGLDIANGGSGELLGSGANEQYAVTGNNQLTASGIQFDTVHEVNAGADSVNEVISLGGETWALGADRAASANDSGIDFVNIDSVVGSDLHVDAATNNRSEHFVLAGNVLGVRGIDFSSVSSVDAGTDEGDSLTANDVAEWQLDGTNGAVSSAEVSFSGMDQIASQNAQLRGTGNVDSFALDGEQALTTYGMAFTGITDVVSGAGRDTLRATEGADQFSLAASGDISVAGIRFGGLESVDAAGGSDTVDAEGAGWTSVADGDVYADGSALATVESIEVLFENLEQVNGTGAYTGLDIDSEYLFDSLNTMTVGGISFAGVNSLVAGSGSDIFRAADMDTAWELNNTGGLVTAGDASLQFSGFESLFAGNGADQFELNGGALAELDTGGGNDTVRMAGSQLGALSLGEGDDYLQVDVASNQELSLSGGGGNDRFQFNVAGATWQMGRTESRVGNLRFSGFEWLDNNTGNLTLETGLDFSFVNGDEASADFNRNGAGILFADSGVRLGYDGGGDLNIISSTTGTIGGHLQADRAELVVSGDVDITSDVHTLAIDTAGGNIDIAVVADKDLVIDEIDAGRGSVILNSANFGSLTAETYGDTHITAGNVQIGSDLQRWSVVGSAVNPLRMNVTQTAELVALSYFQPDFIGQMPDFTSRGDELQSVAGAQTSQGLSSAMQNVVDDFAQVDPGIFTAVNPYSAGVEVVNNQEMALTNGELQPVGPPSEDDEEEERGRLREPVPPLDAVRGGAGQ